MASSFRQMGKQNKSQILNGDNNSAARSLEQKCFLLQRRNADLGFQISSKKSEVDEFDAKYQTTAEQFRELKTELDVLNQREEERNGFYKEKILEMVEFKKTAKQWILNAQSEVECMVNSVSDLRSTLKVLQNNDAYTNNFEISEAKKRNSELHAIRDDLNKSLSANQELRLSLQEQLQKVLSSQDRKVEPLLN